MKIIRISLLGCPSCITMNNVFNKVKEEYEFEYEELDYDLDSMTKYKPGIDIPVYIFLKDGVEVARLCGIHTKEEFDEILKKY